MRGLTQKEKQILLCKVPKGEAVCTITVERLIKDGRIVWKAVSDNDAILASTYFGRLALAVCLVSDEH